MHRKIAKVISSGEAGVERAALYIASVHGMEYGGYTAKDGLTEDFAQAPGVLVKYPDLQEAATLDPVHRARLLVEHSDATLIIIPPHTLLYEAAVAEATALKLGRPCLVTDGSTLADVQAWLATLADGIVLNIMGPSESQAPDGHSTAYFLLEDVLGART